MEGPSRVKYKALFILLVCFVSSACSPVESLPATAAPSDPERVPTVTTTPGSEITTPTLAPIASPSATPIPSSKGSEKILFVSDRDGNEEIYVMDADGSHATRLTRNPGRDIGPQWSPDGTKIAFLSERENQEGLYVMDLDGTNQKLLASTVVFRPGEFSWSPDSARLVYSSLSGGRSDLSVINSDGAMERNLTATDTEEEMAPAWSPDGTWIAFYENHRHQYFIMNASGGDAVEVVNVLSLDGSQPHWSPNGVHLLVSASNEIFAVNLNVGLRIQFQLTNNLNYDGSPAVSPDGTDIAFVSTRSQGSHEIFIMNLNGDYAETISSFHDTRASISNLTWSAAGDRVLFTIRNYGGGLTAEILSIDRYTGEVTYLSQDPSASNYLSDVAP